MDKFYTLITGSSSGIGKALAIECAKRKMNVVMVSRQSERLMAAVKEVTAVSSGDVKYFAADLSEYEAPGKIHEWCRNQGLKVNMLINNAGITGTMPFEDCTVEYLHGLIMVNIRALTILTRFFIDDMKSYGKARIVNIGSMSGFLPLPYKGVYAASKAYVYSFTISLMEELKETGIEVYLSAPNGVSSNPLVTERIESHKMIGRIVSLTPESYASMLLDNIDEGKKLHIPLFSNRFLFFLSRILPDSLIAKLMKHEFKKEFGSQNLRVNLHK